MPGSAAKTWRQAGRLPGGGGRGADVSDGSCGKTFRPYHAINVPREADLENACRIVGGQPMTTLMLRHIPNKYSQAGLLKEIDGQGFKGKYDFFYMPMDIHNRTNVGYAFINFLTVADAKHFFLRFSSYKFEYHPSGKIGTVAPGHVQGLAKNVFHFANRAVAQSRNMQYRPLVFRDGKQVDIKTVFQQLREEEEDNSVHQAETSAKDPSPRSGLNPEACEFVPQEALGKSSALGSSSSSEGLWESPKWVEAEQPVTWDEAALNEAGRLEFLDEIPARCLTLHLLEEPSTAASSRSRSSSSVSGGSTAALSANVALSTDTSVAAAGGYAAALAPVQSSALWAKEADFADPFGCPVDAFGHPSHLFPFRLVPPTF